MNTLDIFDTETTVDLISWNALHDETQRVQQLKDWLKGFDIPATGPNDEPYQLLLRSAARAESSAIKRALAASLAVVLSSEEIKTVLLEPFAVSCLYNALILAAGLGCPDQLNASLMDLLDSEVLYNLEYDGLDLLDALRRALTFNQLNSILHPYWLDMLNQADSSRLPGSVYDGLEGVRQMPLSEASRGEPAISEIGEALCLFAWSLQNHSDRRTQFKSALRRVSETYPLPKWNWLFIQQAHRHGWPTWAVNTLDSLLVKQPSAEPYTDEYLAWAIIANTAPDQWGMQICDHLCSSEVFHIKIKSDCSQKLHDLAQPVENARRKNPLPSEHSALAFARVALLDYYHKLEGSPELKASIKASIQGLSLDLGLPVYPKSENPTWSTA